MDKDVLYYIAERLNFTPGDYEGPNCMVALYSTPEMTEMDRKAMDQILNLYMAASTPT